MLPALEIRHRLRPVDLVAPRSAQRIDYDTSAPAEGRHRLDVAAPYAAVTAELGEPDPAGRLELTIRAADGCRLTGSYDGSSGRLGLEVTDAQGTRTSHRSRRHGRATAPVQAVALALTGMHLTVFSSDGHTWTARGRVDVTDRIDPRDESWLASLAAEHSWVGPDTAPAPLQAITTGSFGQLGLRDVRFVTHADGSPYRLGERFVLTATHAGPGFFDTGHTGVWTLDPAAPELMHVADLFFRRPDRPGVFGDHASHLVRDGERWLVATSTWGDFDRAQPGASVGVTLATTGADLLGGAHVLDTEWLRLPTDALRRSVGVWDPHLVRIDDLWHVGFVSARRFFRFHPALAVGPSLDDLVLRGADESRLATEGTTLVRIDGSWRVLASDGRDGRRGQRRRFPVFDLAMHELQPLEAPYPTNIPWPTVVPHDGGWLWVTFDGTPYGGGLVGYGTHGGVVVGGTSRTR